MTPQKRDARSSKETTRWRGEGEGADAPTLRQSPWSQSTGKIHGLKTLVTKERKKRKKRKTDKERKKIKEKTGRKERQERSERRLVERTKGNLVELFQNAMENLNADDDGKNFMGGRFNSMHGGPIDFTSDSFKQKPVAFQVPPNQVVVIYAQFIHTAASSIYL